MLNDFEDKLQAIEPEDLFSKDEISLYAGKANKRSLAVRWLIKEILVEHYKDTLQHRQISITGNENGKPVLSIQNKNVGDKIHISMSHSRNYITAMVVIENV